MKGRRSLGFILVLAASLMLVSCTEVVKVGSSVGAGMGKISYEDKQRIDQLAVKTEKAVRPMTEQEEYYLGRSVAATILSQYRLYMNDASTRYVNMVGQSTALASDRPFTYGGYRFAILDTDEVNALACPGGIIFITRGMMKRARNEEELAAILAHEVAHVNHNDGAGAIQRSRWVQVVTSLGAETARKLSGAELDKLVSLFEGSVNDVVKALIVNGYSRQQEASADLSAMTFMNRIGYDPNSFTDYLEKLTKEQNSGASRGLFATHPGMTERLSKSRSFLVEKKCQRMGHPTRDQRFQQSME